MSDNEQIKKFCATFGSALAEHLIAQEIGIQQWSTISATFLAMRASQKVEFLRFELADDKTYGAYEALDVAALAMMIWIGIASKKHE